MLKQEEQLVIHDITQEVEREYGRPNISLISKRSGYDRRTVQKYLNSPTLATKKQKRNCSSKLDPYKALITSKLAEDSQLSARRIYHELRESGYTGGYTILTDYLRLIRKKNHSCSLPL